MEVKILRLVVTHSCSHGYYTWPLKFEFHYCEIPSQGTPSMFLNYTYHLEICITLVLNFKHPSQIPPPPLYAEFSTPSFSTMSLSFFPRTKIRKEKKRKKRKKNPRVGVFITRQSSNPDFLPSFLYYLRRDDFTKLNFCRPTVNNDNSRPSLSAPAEARQRRKLWLF